MEDTTMHEGEQQLFSGLTFAIIPNFIPELQQQQLAEDITAAGGVLQPFDASYGRIDNLEEITHIISLTSDFPDYHRALDLFKHVVKPSWISACLRITKVKNPRTYSPDPALFMSEVVLCCGDIPEGDKEAIEGGVVAMGGQYTPILSKLVTHLIALDMQDERVQLAISKRLNVQILLPHWFDDCLKVGRRISERPYVLPDPEILNVEAGAIPTTRASPLIRDAANPEPTKEPASASTTQHTEPARAIKAFSGKKVMLGEDLPLNPRLREVIADLVKAGGGDITNSVDQAHIYVCNYREGADYVKASQAQKDVGNLSWLYYMITYDVWTNPMRRMMHYPRPRDGIPGFQDYKISISSYSGEARVYLENLIRACGAEFTKTFRQDNTHLITAHKQSEKCEAAQEWGVHVVNHLWLEESYARCKEQTLTDSRYIYFPSRTNLGEILGQTELDREAVEKNFFPKITKPVLAKAGHKNNVTTSVAPARVASDPQGTSTPAPAKAKRTKTAPETATPSRYIDGKENETPGTTGSRGAKGRALTKLHEAASDIAKFEKEMKRKGGVVHGGPREKDLEVTDKSKKNKKSRDSTSSKRSIDEVDVEDEESEDDLARGPAKKTKTAKKESHKLSPIKYRMVVSKADRWLENPEKEAKEKATLRELGLFITDDPKKVDLLCAPKILRTPKFVSALACGPTVVALSYIDYALKHNKLPPPEKHLLEDHQFESDHGFTLSESVARARQNQKRLLKGWTVFCTDAVTGGFKTFSDIIAANGGTCNLWKGRTTHVSASKRTIDAGNTTEVSQNQQEDDGNVLYLLSEPRKSELKLWESFRALAKKHDMVPRIVRTEWILFVAMAQYVHWDPEWELTEDMVKK